MNTEAWLSKLTSLPMASGLEGACDDALTALAAPLCDEISKVPGALVFSRRGAPSGPHLLIAVHRDQVVLWVREVLPGGFLRFAAPGIDPRVLPGTLVRVGGQRAIIGMKPPHLLHSGAKETVEVDDLAIDLGLSEAKVRQKVRVGDPVFFDAAGTSLLGGRFTAPALDNRASLAAAYLTLELLAGEDLPVRVDVVATGEEEAGLIGAAAAAEFLQPDVALAVDVTFGRADGLARDQTVPLGGGPAVGIGPNCSPSVVDGLCAAAGAAGVTFQLEPLPGSSGTDAWAIQVASCGIPTGTVSIPLLAMHSPVEVVSTADIDDTARLLAAYVRQRCGGHFEKVNAWT